VVRESHLQSLRRPRVHYQFALRRPFPLFSRESRGIHHAAGRRTRMGHPIQDCGRQMQLNNITATKVKRGPGVRPVKADEKDKLLTRQRAAGTKSYLSFSILLFPAQFHFPINIQHSFTNHRLRSQQRQHQRSENPRSESHQQQDKPKT